MTREVFDQRLAVTQRRLEVVQQQAITTPGDPLLLYEALHQLAYALEQLRLSTEALRARHEPTRLGLHGAIALPIRAAGPVLGVMAFLSRAWHEPDPDCVQMLDGVGWSIGQFVARRNAEAATRDNQARFHVFMDHSPTGTFMKDEAGRFVYIDAAFERFFHTTFDAVRGKTDADRVRANDLAVLATDQTMELSETVPTADGQRRDWVVFKVPFTDTAEQRFVGGMTIDTTERTRAERDLQKTAQQRERLADIGAITAQIVPDRGNPLAGVAMRAQLILHRAERNPQQPVRTVVQPAKRIVAEIFRLDSLVKEFMDVSHDQRWNPKPLSSPPFLRDVADCCHPVAAARQITVTLDVPNDLPPVTTDEDELRRVFENLVKHAVEAIGAGPGHTGITVTLPAADRVRISVADDGSGIPGTGEVSRLFETTRRGGTGFGSGHYETDGLGARGRDRLSAGHAARHDLLRGSPLSGTRALTVAGPNRSLRESAAARFASLGINRSPPLILAPHRRGKTFAAVSAAWGTRPSQDDRQGGPMDVTEVMTRDVKTCGVQDTLNTAARIMWEHDCGCVPVVDSMGRVVGVLTDRDVCMAAYTRGEPLAALGVVATMSKDVHTCTPKDSVTTAEKIMRTNRVRRLPVIDVTGRLGGIVSLNDLARAAVRERARKTKRRVKADEIADTLAAICEPHAAHSASAA